MMKSRLLCVVCAAFAFTSAHAASVVGTSGNDFLFFESSIGQFTETLVNPYSGQTVAIDREGNIMTATYDGLGGIDVFLASDLVDILLLDDGAGNQTVSNIEIFLMGSGDDILHLASNLFTLGDLKLDGGAGNDLIWSNSGSDVVRGLDGADIIDAGPGNDTVIGGVDNDDIRGGLGDDVFIFNAGDGFDVVFDTGGYDTIKLNGLISDITFSWFGNDFLIEYNSGDSISIKEQLTGGDMLVEELWYNGDIFDLTTIATVPVPPALWLFGSGLLGLIGIARKKAA